MDGILIGFAKRTKKLFGSGYGVTFLDEGAEYMVKFQPWCWDGKEGGNVLSKKREVWNTKSAIKK